MMKKTDMVEFKHSPERDEEVLKEITDIIEFAKFNTAKLECLGLSDILGYLGETEELLLKLIPLTKELMSITCKWRSKAMMRASKIEELTILNDNIH